MSQRVGDSMRNHASGGGRLGPQPDLWCLPYGAWRNLREMKVGGAIR